MAYINIEHCFKCKCKTTHLNGKCSNCSKKESELKRRQHFGKLDSMTIEERLRRLEEMQYETSINSPWIEPKY